MSVSHLLARIVDKINNSIGQDPDSKVLIGVLDIYGFESFKTNRCLAGMLCFLYLQRLCRKLHQNPMIFCMKMLIWEPGNILGSCCHL